MIALVNYGLGNIQAFANVYRRLGIPVRSADRPGDLKGATKIVLPGVGAFDWAMRRLNESGFREVLDEVVLQDRVDVLGVCVGMQIMAQCSDEGDLPGLGWIDADVRRIPGSADGRSLPLPHMGWNDVVPAGPNILFRNIIAPRFYFLHSYFFAPRREADVLASTAYVIDFASAVQADNIYGTQFHPEKSHGWGVQLLRNFAEL